MKNKMYFLVTDVFQDTGTIMRQIVCLELPTYLYSAFESSHRQHFFTEKQAGKVANWQIIHAEVSTGI
jgi:hypothetical protein